MSTMLQPLAIIDSAHPFSTTVEAADASPGVPGRAYTTVSRSVAQDWAKVAVHNGSCQCLQELLGHDQPEGKAGLLQLIGGKRLLGQVSSDT